MTNMNNRLRHERATTERTVQRASRATERARAVTKAKAKKQRIVITSIACTLVIAIAATFAVMGFSNNNVKTADTAPTSVTKMINTDLAAAKADKTDTKKDNTANTTAGQSAQSVQTAQPAVQQTAVQPAVVQTNDNSVSQPASQSATEASQDRIDNINGERVYIDTKRTAPDVTGTPAHYYAYGKTSYGFDWNYNADNGNFVLRCDYNFDQQQYDFQFYGTAPGTANVTLYYNTDDNTQVPVQLTVNVDSDLNASIG